jgi:glutamate-1-semialdehyde 2,1-aminomutase
MGIFFGTSAVRDYEGAHASAATGHYPALMQGLLSAGVAIAPGPYEAWFPSLAHGPAELERTVDAFAAVTRAVAASAPASG